MARGGFAALATVLVSVVAADAAAEARPKALMVCRTHCVVLQAPPASVPVDLVVIGAAVKPRFVADGAAVPFSRCGPGRDRWCAYGLRLGSLEPAEPESTKLVGPDVVPTPVATGSVGADVDSFEDVVLVGGPKGYRCTGVIIAPRHVLTAAHCAPATHIGLGADADSAARVAVTASDPHPTLDVAVLTLAAPVEAAAHARRQHGDDEPPAGIVRVLGYGVRDPLRFTGFGARRQVDLIADGWGCPVLQAAKIGCQPGAEMHLRDPAGNDTCFGDSGGPVFEATADGWRLLAITSRGVQPRRVLCGEGGIYVRVDRLATWLRKATSP